MPTPSQARPAPPRRRFARHLARHGLVAASLLLFSLGIGVVGFHVFTGEHWLDAFLDASMLLGGMGPVGNYETTGAKWFAACYALYSGIVFLGSLAIFLTPIVHRLLHKIHLDEEAAG